MFACSAHGKPRHSDDRGLNGQGSDTHSRRRGVTRPVPVKAAEAAHELEPGGPRMPGRANLAGECALLMRSGSLTYCFETAQGRECCQGNDVSCLLTCRQGQGDDLDGTTDTGSETHHDAAVNATVPRQAAEAVNYEPGRRQILPLDAHSGRQPGRATVAILRCRGVNPYCSCCKVVHHVLLLISGLHGGSIT